MSDRERTSFFDLLKSMTRKILKNMVLWKMIYCDVSVKSINCVCARTNKQFILIDTPNTENEIKWCEHAILWEFEVFEDCGNCVAMEQSDYINEWQNLLLPLTSYYSIRGRKLQEVIDYRVCYCSLAMSREAFFVWLNRRKTVLASRTKSGYTHK